MDIESRILCAASSMFADKGFRGCSVKDIARKAGCNEVTVFRKFSTKDDLITAVLNDKLLRKVPVELYVRIMHRPPDEFYRGVASIIYETRFEDPEVPRLMMYTALESPVGAHRIRDYLGDYFSKINEYNEARAKEGVIRRVNRVLEIRCISYLIHGHFFYQELLGITPVLSKEELIDSIVDIMMNGIKTVPGESVAPEPNC